uniref:Uncharacterized protein n=1 Tax=Acrobeloides nanus TaxID=290746 RepID=A0A914CTZ6_9BILA
MRTATIFARFKEGDRSLEDKKGRGRPSDFDDQALLDAMEEDQSLTTRMLAEEFNISHVGKFFEEVDDILDDTSRWIASKNPE